MKKILSLFCILILVFTLTVLTACGEKQQDGETAPSSSVYERSKLSNSKNASIKVEETASTTSSESDSTTDSTIKPETSSAPQSSKTPTQSESQTSSTPTSTNPTSSTPASSASVSSTTPTSSTPTSSTPTSSQTPPESTVPYEVQTVIQYISRIGIVTEENFTTKEQYIKLADSEYNKLSAQNKALVTNYDDLVTAKNAFEEYNSAKVYNDFLTAYHNLPNGLNKDNYSQFKSIIALYDALSQETKSKLDSQVKTNIDAWREQVDQFAPVNVVFDFTTADGWTSDNSATTQSGGYGANVTKGGGTAVYETTKEYNNVTGLTYKIYSAGASGIRFDAYIGDTLVGTGTTSSSGKWFTVSTQNTTPLSGKIRIVLVNNTGSNRLSLIDDVTFTYNS